MKNLTIGSYFRFLAFMLMISTFLPIIFYNLPPIIGSHHIWTSLWLVSLIVFKIKIIKYGPLLSIILYGVIIILIFLNTIWYGIKEWDQNLLKNEFYQVLIGISIIAYFKSESDFIGLAKLTKWTIIFIIITSLLSIYTSILNPMYVRDITGLSAIEDLNQRELILSYRKYGGGTYGFSCALICLFPIIIFYIKNREVSLWNKYYLLIFLLIMFIALLRMQIVANIILSIVIIILSLFGSKNRLRSTIFISLFIVILIIIPVQFYVDILSSIGGLFKMESELYLKLNDMADFLSSGGELEGTGTGTRAERYPYLWNLFITNPVLGGNFGDGHLHWMNKLVVVGLVGMIPFLLIIIRSIKINLKPFNSQFAFYYLLSSISVIILGLLKALSGRELWYVFFVILPGSYYLPLLRKQYGSQFNRS